MLEGQNQPQRTIKEIKLEIEGANVLASTWIISALIKNLDNGNISNLRFEKLTKGKNSIDWLAWLGVGVGVAAIIVAVTLYARGKRNAERRFQDLSRMIQENRDELLPIVRGLRFIGRHKKARVEKMKVEDIEISRATIDPKSAEELGLYDDKDKYYLE